MLLLQMAIPELRSKREYSQFVRDLQRCEHDLQVWRNDQTSRSVYCDFSLVDRRGGQAWDLARKLVCKRNAPLR